MIKGEVHKHLAADGTEYTHSHNEEPERSHSHQNTKSVIDRLSRASGHLNSVKRMVEEGKGLQRGINSVVRCYSCT